MTGCWPRPGAPMPSEQGCLRQFRACDVPSLSAGMKSWPHWRRSSAGRLAVVAPASSSLARRVLVRPDWSPRRPRGHASRATSSWQAARRQQIGSRRCGRLARRCWTGCAAARQTTRPWRLIFPRWEPWCRTGRPARPFRRCRRRRLRSPRRCCGFCAGCPPNAAPSLCWRTCTGTVKRWPCWSTWLTMSPRSLWQLYSPRALMSRGRPGLAPRSPGTPPTCTSRRLPIARSPRWPPRASAWTPLRRRSWPACAGTPGACRSSWKTWSAWRGTRGRCATLRSSLAGWPSWTLRPAAWWKQQPSWAPRWTLAYPARSAAFRRRPWLTR